MAMIGHMILYITGSIVAVLLFNKVADLINQRNNRKELKKLLDKWENERKGETK